MRKAMRQRLQDEGFAGFKVAQLLVLPGHTLASTPVGFPRERIVDAKDAPELCHRVLRVIKRGRQNARIRPDGRACHFFWRNQNLVDRHLRPRAGF